MDVMTPSSSSSRQRRRRRRQRRQNFVFGSITLEEMHQFYLNFTEESSIIKVGVHTIWCHFGQFKFVQKDHFQKNTNQSYISI